MNPLQIVYLPIAELKIYANQTRVSQQGVLREFISPEMKNTANLPNNCNRLLVVWPYEYWANITAPIKGKDIEFAKIKLSIARQTLYSEVIQITPM